MDSSTPRYNLAATLRRLAEEEEVLPLTWDFVSRSLDSFYGLAQRKLTLQIGRRQHRELCYLMIGGEPAMTVIVRQGVKIQVLVLDSFYRVVEHFDTLEDGATERWTTTGTR